MKQCAICFWVLSTHPNHCLLYTSTKLQSVVLWKSLLISEQSWGKEQFWISSVTLSILQVSSQIQLRPKENKKIATDVSSSEQKVKKVEFLLINNYPSRTGLETYSHISSDSGDWLYPIHDRDGINIVLQGSVWVGKITYPLDRNNRHISDFHYISDLRNSEKQGLSLIHI